MNFDETASAAWLASTVHPRMTAAALKQLDIAATARRVNNTRELRGLRVEGHLMYGVASLVAQKAHLLVNHTNKSRKDLERELDGTKQMAAPDSPETMTQTQTLDISSDFSLDRVIEEMRPATQDYDDDFELPDVTIDDELRGDDDEQMMGDEADDQMRYSNDEVRPQPADTLTEGDEQILRGILGSDAPEAPDGPPSEAPVEMTTISSPPEVNTPEYDDLEESIEPTEPVKSARPRKKRTCPVDTRTTIARPTRPPASIIRSQPQQDVTATTEQLDSFFDPESIANAIKRRRLADIPSDVPDLEHSDLPDVSVAGISMDDMDAAMDVPMEDDVAYNEINDSDGQEEPAGGPTLDVIGSLAEDENLEELMAQEIQSARRALREVQAAAFSQVAAAKDTRSRAALFGEALVLATQGRMALQQTNAYGEIELTAI